MSVDELERRFLRAAQRELGPSPADRERNQAALFERLGAGPASSAWGAFSSSSGAGAPSRAVSSGAGAPSRAVSSGAGAPTRAVSSGASAGGVAAVRGSRWGMLGVGLVVGAMVGGGFGFGLGRSGWNALGRSGWNAPAPVEATAPPALPSAAQEASLSEASRPGVEPRAPAQGPVAPVREVSAPVDNAAAGDASRQRAPAANGVRAARRAPAPAPPESSLAAELALLQRARRALNAENARLALGIVQELDERFPKGVLVEERSATRILSLCQLEQVAEAKRAASDFLVRYPASVYAERVRQSCAASPR